MASRAAIRADGDSIDKPRVLDNKICENPAEGILVLSDLGNPEYAMTDVLEWQNAGSMIHTWDLSGVLEYHLREPGLTQLATRLVQENCYATRKVDDWLDTPAELEPMVVALQLRDLVKYEKQHHRMYVALTDKSIHGEPGNISERLVRVWTLESPKPALRAREDIPLEDCTSYELVLRLRADGFTWQQWIPLAQRKKGMKLPLDYRIGEPKLFFSNAQSTVVVCPKYLQCLVKAEDNAWASIIIIFVKGMCQGLACDVNLNMYKAWLSLKVVVFAHHECMYVFTFLTHMF